VMEGTRRRSSEKPPGSHSKEIRGPASLTYSRIMVAGQAFGGCNLRRKVRFIHHGIAEVGKTILELAARHAHDFPRLSGRDAAVVVKHGGKTIVIARFLPIVRTFAPILAGMGHMHYPRFLVFNVVGALLWAVGLILTGYTLGNSIPGIDRYLLPILLLIILTSIAPTLFHILKDKTYRSSLLAQIKKLSRGKQGDAREKLSTPVPPSEVSAFQTIARQGGHGSPDTSGESPAEALSADRPLGRSSVSGHADIERSLAFIEKQAEPAILGRLVFISAQAGEDFDPGDDLLMDVYGQGLAILKYAIHAEPHADRILKRTKVDV